MNLGVIYIKAFLVIIAISFAVSIAASSLLRFVRRISWRAVFAIALPLWLVVGFFALDHGHRRLFVAWHRWQNDALPHDGCLTYDPDFARLYATYRINRRDFEKWVAQHPWNLHPGNNGYLHHDGPQLGITNPELSFETESALNGKQFRVYFKSDIMYVSYNVM